MSQDMRALGFSLLGLVMGLAQGCGSLTFPTADAATASDQDAAEASDEGSTAAPDASSTPEAVAMTSPATDVVKGEAFAGGTRLRAVLAEASDGTALFLHWWDTQLEERCQFESVDEPEVKLRCLPRSVWSIYEGIEELFADARCSQRLMLYTAPPSGGPPKVVQLVDTRCWVGGDYFRVGARFTANVAYRKSKTGCLPEDVAPGAFYTLDPLSPKELVGARVVAGATLGQIAAGQLVAEDGSRAPQDFFVPGGDFECSPRQTSVGMRCLPTSFAWGGRGGPFADARCSQPAAVSEVACGGVGRSALPYVLFEAPGASAVVGAIHRGGARLAEVFARDETGACAVSEVVVATFAIGQALALDDFLPAALAPITLPNGLVQTRAQVGGFAAGTADTLTVARFDKLATSALGGYECSLAVSADGVVRCVPDAEDNNYPQYGDARCTQQIWQTWSERISIQVGDPVKLATGTAGPLELPRVDRVLTGGVMHKAPVYARQGADCSVVPGVPNLRQEYRSFSGEARLSDLPALPIVVR
jgi:predicted small lipoprotein YifL